MATNKVVFGTTVLVDLTDSTVTADTLTKGVSAYARNGEKITGTLVTQNYYTGSNEPTSSIGNDGDLYLVI